MRGIRSVALCIAGAILLPGCAARPVADPRPAPPVPAAPPRPTAAPPVEAAADDWSDRPLTPGDWTYDAAAREARYGDFSLRCDVAARRVALSRAGASGPLRLRTTFGERILPAGNALPADDPVLDELAFSRGRFAVEAPGTATLVLPAWPEPARIVEDCRE